MEKKILPAIPVALFALLGVELASLFNITSTAGRLVAGAVGALGGVLLAGEI